MNRKIAGFIVSLTAVMCLNACGSNVLTTLEKGASNYAENSEGKNLQSSNILNTLDFLLDHYTSGLTSGDENQMSGDKFNDAFGTWEDNAGDLKETEEIQIAQNYEEFKQIVSEHLKKMEENFAVRLMSGNVQKIMEEASERKLFEEIYEEEMQIIPWTQTDYTCIQYNDSDWVIRYHMTYELDVEHMKMMKEEQKKALDEVCQTLNLENLSDIERVKAINNYLCETVEYPAVKPYSPESHTIYGALIEKSAVCEGYARTVQALLEMCGTESYYVVGVCSNGEGHGWNLVQVEGEWYQLDVTWNDGAGKPYQTYFLVTDEFMKVSRTWDLDKYPRSAKRPYS